MSSQIPGVPEGWELVRFGLPKVGEWFLGSGGKPIQAIEPEPRAMWPVIRRIEPVCTWQHGVWKDGWIIEDKNGTLWIFSTKPVVSGSVWALTEVGDDDEANWLNVSRMLNPPKFRSDLPWTERIQRVGPTIEATLKGAT